MKNPSLFFSDFFAKRSNKKVGKAPQKVPAKKSASNLDLTHVNFYKPIHYILHSGESLNGGANHLRLWLPTLIRANVNFVILVRNEPFYNWVKREYPWISVAYAKRVIDVEELIKLLPDTKYVLYPSSTGNNIHLVRFNHLNHVFIGHGDSDKASSAHKALRLFDEIWTAGQAHIDRFKNSDFKTNHLTFLKVGRPNLNKVLTASQVNWKTRLDFNILYLPTWEGVIEETNYSSIHLSGVIIRELQSLMNIPISVKYHPFTGNRNSALLSINQLTNIMIQEDNLSATVLDAATDLGTEIPKNNIFICDISGVVSECLAANAPIFVYIPSDRVIKIASSDMTYEDYCYTFSSVEELLEKMEQVLNGDDYLAEKRLEAIDYFIGFEETLNNKFVEQLQSIGDQKSLKYTSRLFDEL